MLVTPAVTDGLACSASARRLPASGKTSFPNKCLELRLCRRQRCPRTWAKHPTGSWGDIGQKALPWGVSAEMHLSPSAQAPDSIHFLLSFLSGVHPGPLKKREGTPSFACVPASGAPLHQAAGPRCSAHTLCSSGAREGAGVTQMSHVHWLEMCLSIPGACNWCEPGAGGRGMGPGPHT